MMPPTPPDQAPALKEPAVGLQTLSGKAQKIHQVLPQTQCQRCGWADCASYAQAVANQQAAINQCAPGGTAGIVHIAAALGNPALAQGLTLDAACGYAAPETVALTVAVIDEAWCIGCTKCIQSCPVDAIVGSHKKMHTVLEQYCTGCELCATACPVDCIRMEPVSNTQTACNVWTRQQASQSLQRYEARLRRIQGQSAAALPAAPPNSRSQTPLPQAAVAATAASDKKQAIIAAALARARERRAQMQQSSSAQY